MLRAITLLGVGLALLTGCARWLVAPSGGPSTARTTAVATQAPADWRDIRVSWFVDGRQRPNPRVLERGWLFELGFYAKHATRTGCNAIGFDLPMSEFSGMGGPSIIRPACIDWARERAPRVADIDGPTGLAAGIRAALR
ncbi:MAG: hypothetical protein AAGK04_12505, partial [Planctomycetota bacterium]